MIRYLTIAEVIALQRDAIDLTGGAHGLRDLGRLQSSVALPQATFGGMDLYPTIPEKAAALAFSLISKWPDGLLTLHQRPVHSLLSRYQ